MCHLHHCCVDIVQPLSTSVQADMGTVQADSRIMGGERLMGNRQVHDQAGAWTKDTIGYVGLCSSGWRAVQGPVAPGVLG